MKARIVPPAPPTALAWALEDRAAELEKVCAAAGVRLRAVKRGQASCTVAALCGLPGPEESAADAPAPADTPALVLFGLDKKGLDDFLDRLKGAGVAVPLKAVVTPTNRAWTFARLLEELAAERRELENRTK